MDINFVQAQKIKGYGSKSYTGDEIEKIKKETNIQLNVIHNLNEYVDFIDKLSFNSKNPIFYRGHENANYLSPPSP